MNHINRKWHLGIMVSQLIPNFARWMVLLVASVGFIYAETVSIDQVQSDLNATEPYISPNPLVQPSRPAVPATIRFTRLSPVGDLDVRVKIVAVANVILGTDYSISGMLAPFAIDIDGDLSAEVRFMDGQSQTGIVVTPLDDALVEGRESLQISIKEEFNGLPLSYNAGAPSYIDITIGDNDHRVRLEVPDSIADEDVNLFGLSNDSDIQRRAIVRARFDEFTGPVSWDRNIALLFSTTGNVQPLAALNTDYKITYKICGNATATRNSSRIGYNKYNSGTVSTGVGYMLVAYLPGSTTIKFSGASELDNVFPPNSIITFDNHSSTYRVLTAGKDSFTIDTAAPFPFSTSLQYPLPNGTGMSVQLPVGSTVTDPPQNLTVLRTFSAGSQQINVAFGSGGLFLGDVFQLPEDTSFYVVTSDAIVTAPPTQDVSGNSYGVLRFRRYQGDGVGDGLPADLGGAPILTTRITPTTSLVGRTLRLLVPEESTKVEVAMAPTLAGDGVEGVEEIRLSIISDEDYFAVSPQEAAVFIADRDVTASVKVESNAGLPSQAGYFKISLDKPFTTRSVTVPFSITDTAGGNQYDLAIPNSVTFAPNQRDALILVDPIVAASVTLSLSAGLSYSIAGSPDGSLNPSATMDISSKIGDVSIQATVPTTLESATPTDGRFVVSLNRTTNAALGINLTVGGTATAGSRYQLLNATDFSPYTITGGTIQVSIPAGATNTSVPILVRPINDDQANGNQSVQLTVAPGQAYSVATPTNDTVNIFDDEPTVTISDTDNGGRPSTPGFFYLSLNTAASQPVTVNFTYTGSTGVQDVDFAAVNSVTFSPATTTLPVQINPVDRPDAADFTVTLNVLASTTYAGTPSATISISEASGPSKPTPGTVNSGAASGGCGLGSGLATLVGLGLFAFLTFRRREH